LNGNTYLPDNAFDLLFKVGPGYLTSGHTGLVGDQNNLVSLFIVQVLQGLDNLKREKVVEKLSRVHAIASLRRST
jgi:hypothetical protein